MTIKNVTSAFHATGICPFNWKASIVKLFERSNVMKKSKVAVNEESESCSSDGGSDSDSDSSMEEAP